MKFNGIDPRTLHPGISIAKEIPPGAMTSQLEMLTGSTGEIVAGRTVQQGEYIVRINIAGKTRAEAWRIRAMLAGWAKAGSEKTSQLIPTHWPDVYYDAILKEISQPEFVFGFTTVEVTFTLPRPVAMSTMRSDYEIDQSDVAAAIEDGGDPQPMYTADGNAVYTSNTEQFQVLSEGEQGLIIGGTTWTRPTISLGMNQAEGTRITIDGKTVLALSGSYNENDAIIIYTDPPQILLMDGGPVQNIDNRIDYTVTDFEALCRALTPGRHTFSASNAYSVNITWRDTWL